LKSKRRKGKVLFTPLDDSHLSDREVVRLTSSAFISRPLNSIDNTKLLFSHVSNLGRSSLYLAPEEDPLPVKWDGVGKTSKLRLPRTKATVRFASKALLITSTVLMVALIAAQLSGFLVLRNVATGSMKPNIQPGDIEITVPASFVHVHKGLVAIYQFKSPSGQMVGAVGHRIVGGTAATGWVFKGDANKYVDPQHPKTSQLLGVVVMVLPKVGKYFTLNVAVYGLLALVFYWFVSDFARRRKRVVRN